MYIPVLYKSRCFDKLPRLLPWSLSLCYDYQEQERWRIYVPFLCKCPLWLLTIFQRLQWIFKICRGCKVALCNYRTLKKCCWTRACPGFTEQCHHSEGILDLRKEAVKPLVACWQPEEELQGVRVLPRTALITGLALFPQLFSPTLSLFWYFI